MASLSLNDKIKFHNESSFYTVKAISENFAICTRPFNLRKTVFYTIIDFRNNIRGTDNLVFKMYDYKIQEDIDVCLTELESGVIEVSKRNQVPLIITEIRTKRIFTKPPDNIKIKC